MKGWKTISLNLAALIFGSLEASGVINALPYGASQVAIPLLAAANIYLRSVTNTSVFKSK